MSNLFQTSNPEKSSLPTRSNFPGTEIKNFPEERRRIISARRRKGEAKYLHNLKEGWVQVRLLQTTIQLFKRLIDCLHRNIGIAISSLLTVYTDTSKPGSVWFNPEFKPKETIKMDMYSVRDKRFRKKKLYQSHASILDLTKPKNREKLTMKQGTDQWNRF